MFNNAPTCARAYLRACFRVRTRERSDVVAVGQKRVQPNVSTIAGIFLTLLSLCISLSLSLFLSPCLLSVSPRVRFPSVCVYTRVTVTSLPQTYEHCRRRLRMFFVSLSLSLSVSFSLLLSPSLSLFPSKKLHVCVRSYL